jgi:cytochrome P450
VATFILAMVKYPEVQSKAQAELDSVIGGGQLPTLSDEGSLPYLHAVVKECSRWLVVAPMALPHILIADDEYNGFTFPSGTIVIANSWFVNLIHLLDISIQQSIQGNPSR